MSFDAEISTSFITSNNTNKNLATNLNQIIINKIILRSKNIFQIKYHND